jgi:hypothetical protein
MAAADQSLVAPPQPFEEVTVASRSVSRRSLIGASNVIVRGYELQRVSLLSKARG